MKYEDSEIGDRIQLNTAVVEVRNELRMSDCIGCFFDDFNSHGSDEDCNCEDVACISADREGNCDIIYYYIGDAFADEE